MQVYKIALPFVVAASLLSGCGEAPKPILNTRNGVTKIEYPAGHICYTDPSNRISGLTREISRVEFCGDKEFRYAFVVSLPDTDAKRTNTVQLDFNKELGRGRDTGRVRDGQLQLVRPDSLLGQELVRRFNDLKSRYESSVSAEQK